MDPAETVHPAAPKRARGSKRKKRRKTPSNETKEKDPVPQEQNSDETRPNKKRKRMGGPLKGMIIAVSTLDVKGQSHKESESSYKSVAELCQSMGATVTGQLHRRVSCLVCNETAVNNATQRVRKAVKKKVPLVDVAWVRQCSEEETCVNLEPYLLDDFAARVIESRAERGSEVPVNDATVEVDELPASAWSEPTTLGCCCVCHENGDDNCPWCTSCSANL